MYARKTKPTINENPIEAFAKGLRKGDFIPPEQIAELMEVDESDFKAMNLASMGLEDKLEKLLNVEIKKEGDGLRVLKDNEVGGYYNQRQRNALRMIRRLDRRFHDRIDRSKLDQDERRHLEQQTHVSATITMHINAAVREAKRDLDL